MEEWGGSGQDEYTTEIRNFREDIVELILGHKIVIVILLKMYFISSILRWSLLILPRLISNP